MLERLVCERINIHLGNIGTLQLVQSAYRRNYSTEIALTKVVSDIIMAADAVDVTVLALFDLSAAFDHSPCNWNALQWFTSYVPGRYQSVLFAGETSTPVSVPRGVPQGSVFGPLLFILYISDSPRIIAKYGLLCMCYADDTQLYSHLKTHNMPMAKSMVEACINHVHQWLTRNRLRLHPDKTEGMWCVCDFTTSHGV